MKPGMPVLRSTRLLDQLRERIRYLHYSLSTEKAHIHWVRFFIRWHGRIGEMQRSAPFCFFTGGRWLSAFTSPMNKPRLYKAGESVRMWRFPRGVLRPMVGNAKKF